MDQSEGGEIKSDRPSIASREMTDAEKINSMHARIMRLEKQMAFLRRHVHKADGSLVAMTELHEFENFTR